MFSYPNPNPKSFLGCHSAPSRSINVGTDISIEETLDSPRQTEAHVTHERTSTTSSQTWRAPGQYDHATIMDLVELFFEVVNPIFPLWKACMLVKEPANGGKIKSRGCMNI